MCIGQRCRSQWRECGIKKANQVKDVVRFNLYDCTSNWWCMTCTGPLALSVERSLIGSYRNFPNVYTFEHRNKTVMASSIRTQTHTDKRLLQPPRKENGAVFVNFRNWKCRIKCSLKSFDCMDSSFALRWALFSHTTSSENETQNKTKKQSRFLISK